MPTYLVTVPVTRASGYREYRVESETQSAAIDLCREGKFEVEEEQLETEYEEFEDAVAEEVGP